MQIPPSTRKQIFDRYAEIANNLPQRYLDAGAAWYPKEAAVLHERLDIEAHRVGVLARNAVLAAASHLSPMISWQHAKDGAVLALTSLSLHSRSRPSGIMQRSWDKALLVREMLNRMQVVGRIDYDFRHTFSPRAPKTLAFYEALLGRNDAVPVDTHMIHAGLTVRGNAPMTYKSLTTAQHRAYAAVTANAISHVAHDIKMPPRDFQAAVWLWWKDTKFQ